jgi:hypothetical protein
VSEENPKHGIVQRVDYVISPAHGAAERAVRAHEGIERIA